MTGKLIPRKNSPQQHENGAVCWRETARSCGKNGRFRVRWARQIALAAIRDAANFRPAKFVRVKIFGYFEKSTVVTLNHD